MIVGVVKEIKNKEYRVGLIPESVKVFVQRGHQVFIEKDAGLGSGFTDKQYQKVGASILDSAQEVWRKSDMIIKVKEPTKDEYRYLRENLILYTYLHLAANLSLTQSLLKKKVVGIAYETIQDETGLPCLRPMSEIAGKLSILEGAKFLQKNYEGKGIIISSITGVDHT